MNKVGIKTEKFPSSICKPWGQDKVLLLTPHGADYHWLVKQYPALNEILSDEYIEFLKIEQDFGINEFAVTLANTLNLIGIEVILIKTLYHRGILDGGRIIEWALRDTLPPGIKQALKNDFTELHRNSVDLIKEQCALIKSDGGFVVDLHTMAPFSPKLTDSFDGHASWDNIKDYVENFKLANNKDFLRPIDILTKDENNYQVTDEQLSNSVYTSLKNNSYDVEFNKPYENNTKYMMNTYLNIADGVAIDFPKHLFSKDSLDQFNLSKFELCEEKMTKLAKIIAEPIASRFNPN